MYSQNITFMKMAISLAKKAFQEDEVPVGAVITLNNQIIAKAYNQVETLKDPTAHAEMIAITQAASTIGCKWLIDCEIYVTLEPCSMCAGALILSRLKRIVFGAEDSKTGACGSVFNIANNVKMNHIIDIQKGLLAEECSTLLSDFFSKKR